MRIALTLGLILASSAVPLPAVAQLSNDRVLTIFGEDKCPSDTICVRAPESERFRIPRQFRNNGATGPENQSWAARAQAATDAGARTGAGSCTSVGPGGWTGCYQQQMRAARAETRARTADQSPDLDQ